MEFFEVFDAWEPIIKARKAKGLHKWGSLADIAHKLEGKKESDIAFTCCHPDHPGQVHVLGSTQGNLHFLMGYGNPGFHLAPYHWQVMDPSIDDEAAESLHVKGHPSRYNVWEESGLELTLEGDLNEGEPHVKVIESEEEELEAHEASADSMTVQMGIGTYRFEPSEGLVYGEHNGHVYKWELVRNSFLTAAYPDVVELMETAAQEETEEVEKSFGVPYVFSHIAQPGDFDEEVFPLVKSHFPAVGAVIPIDTADMTVYGVVTKSSIDFYDMHGHRMDVLAYGRLHSGLDLTKSGNTHPSMIYSFAQNHLLWDRDEFEQYFASEDENVVQSILKSTPTPGFEDVKDTLLDSLQKSVVVSGNTFRLVVRK